MEATFIQSSSWMRLLVRWLMRAWQTAEGHVVWLVVHKNVWQGEVWEQSAGGESHDHQLSLRLSSSQRSEVINRDSREKWDYYWHVGINNTWLKQKIAQSNILNTYKHVTFSILLCHDVNHLFLIEYSDCKTAIKCKHYSDRDKSIYSSIFLKNSEKVQLINLIKIPEHISH